MKPLSPTERALRVRAIKEADPRITLNELAAIFDVSEVTIRCDLNPEKRAARLAACRSNAPRIHCVARKSGGLRK